MKIKDSAQLTLGIINIVLGLLILVVFIIDHRPVRILITIFCIGIGIMSIIQSIETKSQRQKRIAELKQNLNEMEGGKENG